MLMLMISLFASLRYLPAVLHNVVALARLADTRRLLGDNAPRLRATHRRTPSKATLWTDAPAASAPVHAPAPAPAGETHARAPSLSAPTLPTTSKPTTSKPAAPTSAAAAAAVAADTEVDVLLRAAAAAAGLHTFELESDRIALKGAGTRTLAELRALRADTRRWDTLRLPLLSRAAIDQQLMQRAGRRRWQLVLGGLGALAVAAVAWRVLLLRPHLLPPSIRSHVARHAAAMTA